MANPTTNYGFVLPTPTDLVTDLPADFDVALQGVDTRLKALQPGTTLGDIAYSSATANTNVRLGIGTNGQVLSIAAGVPAWATTADQTPLTTKGDLFTFTTVDARLGIGANNTVLTADSAEATGMKWAAPAGGGGMTLLASGTLSGTELDLNSINQTYTDLVFEIIDANWGTGDDYFKLRLNNLSTGIYTTVAQGSNNNGSASSFYGAGSADRFIVWGGVTFLRTGKNSIYLTIPDYAVVKGRRDIFGNVCGQNSTPSETAVYWTGFSTNSTAVSRIQFSTQTGHTFTSGSYKLYGVK